MITNQRDLRRLFWQEHPQLEPLHRRTRNYGNTPETRQYPTDVRVAFCDWLDSLHRDGLVSHHLANNAIL